MKIYTLYAHLWSIKAVSYSFQGFQKVENVLGSAERIGRGKVTEIVFTE